MATLTETSPTIIVDRSIGQYVESLDIDTDQVQSFYESLDIPDKRPLGECIINFSGLCVVVGSDGGRLGTASVEPMASQSDRLAPPAHINVFVGTCLAKPDQASKQAGETLAHELVHYAEAARVDEHQATEAAVAEVLLMLDGKLATVIRSLGVIGLGSIVGIGLAYKLLPDNAEQHIVPTVMATVSAFQGIRLFRTREDRKQRRAQLEEARWNKYEAREHEVTASHHEERGSEFVQIKPVSKDRMPDFLAVKEGNPIYNKLTHSAHRSASLGYKLPVKKAAQ